MDDVTASIIIACQTAGAVNSISKLGFAMGMLAKQAASLFYQFSKDSLQSFNDAQNASWKFGKTFKNSMGTATKSVREFMREYNLSEQTAKSMLTDAASILKGFGFSEKEALKMSEQVSRMGVDLASFTSVAGGAREAISSITAAMTGEGERMKKYGTVIRMDNKDFIALTKSIRENQGVTENQARAMAVLQEVIRQNRDAIGDYKAEGENWTQAQNDQREAIIQLKDSLGEMLYKLFDIYGATNKVTQIVREITKLVNDEAPPIVFAIKSLWLSISEGVESVGATIQPFFSVIITGFKNIVTTGQWMRENWNRIFDGMSKTESNFLHGITRDIGGAIVNGLKASKDSTLAVAERFSNFIGWNKLIYGSNQYAFNERAYYSTWRWLADLGSETQRALAKSGITKFPKLESADYSALLNFAATQDKISKKYSSKRSKLENDFLQWMNQRKSQPADKQGGNDLANARAAEQSKAVFADLWRGIADQISKLRETSQNAILANSVEALRLQSRTFSQSPEMKVQQSQLDMLKQIKNGIDKLVGPTRTAPTMVRS